MRRLFISLKGFGDLVILANALQEAPPYLEVEVIVSERLLEMAKMLMPPKVMISSLLSIKGVLPLYSLRNGGQKVFDGMWDLRKAVKQRVNSGSSLVLDRFSYRNELLFYSIPHSYLPKADNIYSSYALEFGAEKQSASFVAPACRPETGILFPFGSSVDRSMSIELLKNLIILFSEQSVSAKIVCHHSDKARIPMDLVKYCTFFDTSDELVQLIKGTQLLVSVDTVAIHLANYFDIPTFVVSDGWQLFIPPSILTRRRLYQSNQTTSLYEDLGFFLSES
jgi:hypothetical protein